MTQMYKKGHLLASFTSSTLDTKDTAKEYDFEWYHDVSDLLQGEAYMQLGVKWQTNFKKKSDVCCGEVVMTRRDMFFVPNKRVWIAHMEERRAYRYPPPKKKIPCPPDISFQRQTNGSVIGKNHLACTLLFVHGKSPEKNTSLSDFFHRLPGKDESSKLFFFHEEPNFQGNLRTPWKTRFGKIW